MVGSKHTRGNISKFVSLRAALLDGFKYLVAFNPCDLEIQLLLRDEIGELLVQLLRVTRASIASQFDSVASKVFQRRFDRLKEVDLERGFALDVGML